MTTTESYEQFSVRRREEILERICSAAQRAGRDPQDISLVAVSKTVGADQVRAALQAGWRHFAENRPQELKKKLSELSDELAAAQASFDMIGNLQTNKINLVVGKVRLIHSISSEHLAQAVASRSQVHEVVSRVLLEVNVSGEESKSGFTPQEAFDALPRLMELEGISVEGLMTMAPAHNPDAARCTFSGLRELAERMRDATGLELATLSCGMSDDFEIAIEEGSTLVRLGRVAFDPGYQSLGKQ